MYCPNCGTNVNENAEFCIKCGTNIHQFNSKQTVSADDKTNIWVNLLSLCCIPILGIVMYYVWKDNQPKAAESALIFGLIGIAIPIIIVLIITILGIVLDSSLYY